MRAKEFIEYYKNHKSISCHDVAKDFGVTVIRASQQIFSFKKSGVLIELTKWKSGGSESGSRAATYKINHEHGIKPDRTINYELKIKENFKKHVSFSFKNVLEALAVNKNTAIDHLYRMCSSGKLFKIGTESIGGKRTQGIYSFIKPDSSGTEFLIEKLIGGTVTNHPIGTKFEACTRHSSDDCIKSNNECGGASMLHTGYGTSTSHTGARRYD